MHCDNYNVGHSIEKTKANINYVDTFVIILSQIRIFNRNCIQV